MAKEKIERVIKEKPELTEKTTSKLPHQNLKSILKDKQAADMSPEEIATFMKMAEDYIAKHPQRVANFANAQTTENGNKGSVPQWFNMYEELRLDHKKQWFKKAINKNDFWMTMGSLESIIKDKSKKIPMDLSRKEKWDEHTELSHVAYFIENTWDLYQDVTFEELKKRFEEITTLNTDLQNWKWINYETFINKRWSFMYRLLRYIDWLKQEDTR